MCCSTLWSPESQLKKYQLRTWYSNSVSPSCGTGCFAGAAGYIVLGHAQNLAVACAGVTLAHSGSAMMWVYSTTLLQRQTEDRYRGRVFAAESAFMVLTMSLSSYYAGTLIDHAVPVRSVATLTGLLMLVPALLWGLAVVRWKENVALGE